MTAHQDHRLWQDIVGRVSSEWQALGADEKAWVDAHVRRLVRLQEALHRHFLAAGGRDICRACRGECCGHGKFHPNLTNLLAVLASGEPLPEPDFSHDCPYGGVDGCQFPPGLRPFNCISFICDRIEERLSPESRAQFYRLEGEIRSEYEVFRARYAGAGMNGILVRGEPLPSYLDRRQSSDTM